MRIKLPYVGGGEIHTENPPENLKELVEHSFREYTKWTNEKYRNEDRLTYIDTLRKSHILDGRPSDFDDAIKQVAKESIEYWLEYESSLDDFEFTLSGYENIERLFDLGLNTDLAKRSNSTHENDVVAEICRIVLNYEVPNED